MRVYEFMLTLATEPDLDTTDRLYGYFGENGAAPKSVLGLYTCYTVRITDCELYRRSYIV